MTVTTASFRAAFSEFADTDQYPDPMVTFWLTYCQSLLVNTCRWGDLLDYGVNLMLAHQCVLATRNAKQAGAIAAPITARSVDKVSTSYDTGMVTLENGGHWNGTSYGVQFLQLARMVGSGGMQL